MFIIDIVHEALISDTPITKRFAFDTNLLHRLDVYFRDIFYRNVPLFKKQQVVDETVDDLAATLRVERDELLVVRYPNPCLFSPLTHSLSVHRQRVCSSELVFHYA